MTTLHFSSYAIHRNCSPGYITKLRHEGRLVLVNGLVDVEASDRMIEQTAGNRDDVSRRHAQSLHVEQTGSGEGVGIGSKEKKAPAAPAQNRKGGNALAQSRLTQEEFKAKRMQLEFEILDGKHIPLETCLTAMRFIGGAVRAALEVFPDQTAPLVAPVTNLAEIHEILTQSTRDALHGVGEEIKRQEAELTRDKS